MNAPRSGSLPPLTRTEVLTWPNLFTFVRLLCIPLFVWLLFGREHRAASAWLLGILATTDWVDGYLARRFDQKTEFGALFDPTVDRLLFLVAVPSVMIDGSIPVWIALALMGRELLVAFGALYLGLRKVEPFAVTWEGKTGTFLLFFAVPAFLGANSTLSYASILEVLAWIAAIPGLAYSYYAAFGQYLPQARASLD
ncbi:MAG: CDP-alcohol phosphatidyltransferase family protein [Acidimicrobiales bacterium]|nr:CDP-alcohol phosphatidyltransferase family protein [Acidimicrobiales bacterium]